MCNKNCKNNCKDVKKIVSEIVSKVARCHGFYTLPSNGNFSLFGFLPKETVYAIYREIEHKIKTGFIPEGPLPDSIDEIVTAVEAVIYEAEEQQYKPEPLPVGLIKELNEFGLVPLNGVDEMMCGGYQGKSCIFRDLLINYYHAKHSETTPNKITGQMYSAIITDDIHPETDRFIAVTRYADVVVEIIESVCPKLGSDLIHRPDDNLKDVVDMDSLDHVEIAIGVEQRFDIEIDDDDLERARSVGDLCELIYYARQAQ